MARHPPREIVDIAAANVPAFTGSTTATLTIPCTLDLDVAATKYFHGLDDGDIPLLFLFSGSVFYEAAGRPPASAAHFLEQANVPGKCPCAPGTS